MLPPWAMMTPSAPDFGTSISAVTAYDLFFVETIEFSRQPAHAAEQQLRVALDQLRAAGEVGVEALERPIVERQHAVLRRLDQPEPLQLVRASSGSPSPGRAPGSSPCSCRRAPRRRRRRPRL